MFSGGAFGTAMQLGVAHALLVSRNEAPDVVVGVSAGAVNAAAVAEILQAGEGLEDEARLDAQTARFREVFAAYQAAPGELVSALKPDSTQIDARRPLEALSLPIHLQEERTRRQEAIEARSGLIRTFNMVLNLGLPVGFWVRALRCRFGWRAAREVAWEVRPLVYLQELFRLLLLSAPYLPSIARLVQQMAVAAIPLPRGWRKGETAGDLTDRSPMLERSFRWALDAVVFVVLTPTWVVAVLACAFLGPLVALAWIGLALACSWLYEMARGCWNAWGTNRSDGGDGLTAGQTKSTEPWRRIALESRRSVRLIASTFKLKLVGVWLRLLSWILVWAVLVTGIAWLVALACGLDPAETYVPLVLIPASLGFAAVLVMGVVELIGLRDQSLLDTLLLKGRLSSGLFHPHALRQIFVRLFDPEYFATVGCGGEMGEIVSRALDPAQPWPKASNAGGGNAATRKVGDYVKADPPIRVGIVAADLATGQSEVLPPYVPVVDALLAATAVCPIFPAMGIEVLRDEEGEETDVRWFIDGVNIANEPTRPTLAFLRDADLAPGVPAIHLYPVCSLPMSQPELPSRGAADGDSRSLLAVVARALDLQRFRDATLERRLTELFSRVIPPQAGAAYDVGSGATKQRYLRAWVYPIEPEAPLSANTDLVRARDDQQRRRIVAETVADGCRAAMEAMMQEGVAEVGRTAGPAPCRQVVAAHLSRSPWRTDLPASDPAGGPGVSEVCRHCALHRSGEGETPQALRRAPESVNLPRWPAKGETSWDTGSRGRVDPPLDERKKAVLSALQSSGSKWPVDRNGQVGGQRATVSLLFGGGVFRGVYLLGVLNALNEARMKPDLVAGASVGSITAAMAARVFSHEGEAERVHGIRELAATYLALDRLILTDRFSDLVRTLTVRGAQARFSFSDADRAFRRYDADRGHRHSEGTRAVIAGIERLLWISPFELLALVRALRLGDSRKTEGLLRLYFQEILDRSGVRSEVLGSEPLQLLIREHVLRGEDPQETRQNARTAQFDAFLPEIVFLATATDLDRGRLEVLGDRQMKGGDGSVALLQGLLASSAFPGVFRPRSRWEVFPRSRTDHRLADGGLMDNLPLDAVVHHLDLAAQVNRLKRRPDNPHLVFTGSLEPEVEDLERTELERVKGSWQRVLRRARELGFNQKLDLYQAAQEALDGIYRQAKSAGVASFEPLHLKVVAVRPKWLCGTFAFHPMLGFRRREQAASIAHGCASTLHRLAEEPTDHLMAWGAATNRLPGGSAESPREQPAGKEWAWPSKWESLKIRGEGHCWFRPEVQCPFSGKVLRSSPLPENTRDQLGLIYKECGRKRTHRAKR